MSERPTPETDATSFSDGKMLTAQSDPITLYQKLCETVDEIETLKRERDEARESAAKWEAVALREASINGARICAKEDAK